MQDVCGTVKETAQVSWLIAGAGKKCCLESVTAEYCMGYTSL